MFCSVHKERIAISTCARCGRGICASCQTIIQGQYWCKDCASGISPSAYTILNTRNPWVAAISSLLMPGIGQVYNGQVSKGIIIFLSFWLIIPWIYGVIDAFITAKRVNRGEVMARPSTGCLIGCLTMVFILMVSPFLYFKVIQYYFLLSKVNAQESLAIATLLKVSKAAEEYAKVNKRYPKSYAEIYFSEPPYINELYCDVTVGGGKYNCVFSEKGYLVTVKPDVGSLLKNSFSVTTGGILVPFERREEVKGEVEEEAVKSAP